MLSNRDNETVDTIKKATSDLQQASLKLFEMAYKKVRRAALPDVLVYVGFNHKNTCHHSHLERGCGQECLMYSPWTYGFVLRCTGMTDLETGKHISRSNF
jgi:hypothetical protein